MPEMGVSVDLWGCVAHPTRKQSSISRIHFISPVRIGRENDFPAITLCMRLPATGKLTCTSLCTCNQPAMRSHPMSPPGPMHRRSTYAAEHPLGHRLLGIICGLELQKHFWEKPMKSLLPLVVAVIFGGCAGTIKPDSAIGNFVTTQHGTMEFKEALQGAVKYCESRGMGVKHVGTNAAGIRPISNFECIPK